MNQQALGVAFEREIREQPAIWESIADSDKADRLARALGGDVVLVGSGSSLFAAEVGALALRRRGLCAHALAATEARLDHRSYVGQTVIALSQSGRSSDLFSALDVLRPHRLVVLTNSIDSPLAARASVAIDVGAGDETAVPASKSVSATFAILLRAASLVAGDSSRDADALRATASTVRGWMDSEGASELVEAAGEIARKSSAAILGSDYGYPVAREAALKIKEASYLHAEGFAAGEFRHGSVAMLDKDYAVIGIVDADALPVVARALADAKPSEALRLTIGSPAVEDLPRLGPIVEDPYNTLGWLVAAQCIALHVARSRGVDSDRPRGLRKALTEPG